MVSIIKFKPQMRVYNPEISKRVHFHDIETYEVVNDENDVLVDDVQEPSYSTMFAVAGYIMSSALLLLVNKITIHELPLPCFVLFTQLLCSSSVTRILGIFDVIDVEPLQVNKIKKFWLVPVIFMMTIFSNVKILQHANVETFIVFRDRKSVV